MQRTIITIPSTRPRKDNSEHTKDAAPKERDLTMIKAFVKYKTDSEDRKEYIKQELQRLKIIIPQLKEEILVQNQIESETDKKLVTISDNSAKQVQDLQRQYQQAQIEIQGLQKQINQNDFKVQRFKQNMKKVQQIDQDLQRIQQNHHIRVQEMAKKISFQKKQRVLKKAQITARKQQLQHLAIINSQKKVIEEISANKKQFQDYSTQLKGIRDQNMKERQENLQQAEKFIKERAKKQREQMQERVDNDIEIICKKISQTDNLGDFKALLKFANVPILEYGLSEQEQTMLKLYLEHLQLKELKQVREHDAMEESVEQLELMESSVRSRDVEVNHLLTRTDEQIDLMQGKYADIIMKLTTLIDRSSTSFN